MYNNIKILLFHRVSPDRDPLWDPMSPELFKKIISYVSKKYEIFFVEELDTIDLKRIKKPIAAITFDDGYFDYANYALPILSEYNAKSSLYIVTDCIDNNEPTWTYIVDHLFSNTTKLSIDLEMYINELGAFNKYQAKDRNDLLSYGKKLKQYLKNVENIYREKIVLEIKTQLNDVVLPQNMMLSWSQIQSFDKSLVCIGSHTKSHPPLATINSKEELKYELEFSYNKINEKLGHYPHAISYPVGSYNSNVMEMSKNIGYKKGLAVDFKVYNIEEDNVFSIPRLELYNESYIKTILRAEGYYYKLKNLIK